MILNISFELALPFLSERQLTDAIKALGPWARVTASTYLVSTQHDPVQVRDYLWKLMKGSDKLYVSVSRAPSAWNGLPADVSDWIQKNQR